jgi:hypothetical protein
MKTERIRLNRSVVAAVVPALGILMAAADRACATTIPLTNPGFDILSGGADSTAIAAHGYYDGPIYGWSNGELLGPPYTPGSINPTSGSIVADVISSNTLSQTTGYAIQATDQYTLSFSVGLRQYNNPIPLTAELVAAGTGDTLASMTISTTTLTAYDTLSPQQMNTYVLAATAPTIQAGDIGENLEVIFQGGGTNSDQDSVDTVALSVVPEPASLGIVCTAAFALLTRRRRVV